MLLVDLFPYLYCIFPAVFNRKLGQAKRCSRGTCRQRAPKHTLCSALSLHATYQCPC